MPTQGISFLRADSETPVTPGPGRASLLLGQMTEGAERVKAPLLGLFSGHSLWATQGQDLNLSWEEEP